MLQKILQACQSLKNITPSVEANRSIPRKVGQSSNSPLFPKVCIFCEKDQIKNKNRKTERPIHFESFKNRDTWWEKLENHAQAIGRERLYIQIKGKYLFACEAL